MRINEDYLDDIELDDLQADVHVNPDIDTREFMYRFVFYTKEMTKGKEPQWYISRLERFYDMFLKMLDKLPFIKDYSREFPLEFGWTIDNQFDESQTENGVRIRYRNDLYQSFSSLDSFFYCTASNKFHFILGIDCKKIDSLEDIRRTLLMLWSLFEGCLKITFRSGCKPLSVRYIIPRDENLNAKGNAEIEDGTITVWKNKPDSDAAKKIFMEAYRAFHQDMKPKQIKPLVDAFCGEQPDVREFFKKYGINNYYVSELVYYTEHASYEGDTLVIDITKNLTVREGFIHNVRDKKIKIKIRYLRSISYEPHSGEFTPVSDYGYDLNWFIENIAPSVEKINLNMNPTALVDFQDVPLDLTKMFPGKTVALRLNSTSTIHYLYPYHGRKCIVPDHDFTATVITSRGKKKYNIHVSKQATRW